MSWLFFPPLGNHSSLHLPTCGLSLQTLCHSREKKLDIESQFFYIRTALLGSGLWRAAKRMVRITVEQVGHLAELVRLRLTAEELAVLASELSRIVAYMELLEEAAAASAPPFDHGPIELRQVRRDASKPGLRHRQALALAPKGRAGFFSVPKVM